MSTLLIYRLSDAFSGLWQELASASGLELSEASAPAELATHRGLVLVAAGGEEVAALEAVRAAGETASSLVVVGASADHRLSAALIRAGAREYFALPQDIDLLRAWVKAEAGDPEVKERRVGFARDQGHRYAMREIVGGNKDLQEALGMAERVIAHPQVTILITGETGTGKELVARAIHYHGPRREAAFVDINCAAIPENLLESELFGHERGAFTGATTAKPGLFEVANGGTVFLDEIGHLALSLQGKILRALEERTIRRVGGQRTIKIDVRVVAATHVDLAKAVREGTFRADLFHRLNVIPLALPPLRQRRDDVLPLAKHFLTRLARDYGRSVPSLTSEAEQVLLANPWPGNVRELRNALERALLLSPGDDITAHDLAFLSRSAQEPGHSTGPLAFPGPLNALVRSAATEMITICGGNKSEAARRLGVSRPRLLRLTSPGSTPSDAFGEDDD